MTEPVLPLQDDGWAVVLGAGGGLGKALEQALTAQHPGRVLGLSRHSEPSVDLLDEATLARAAQHVTQTLTAHQGRLRLLIVSTGFLHGTLGGQPHLPERSWSQLDPVALQHLFAVNAIGPALVMKHFLPLLPRQGSCLAAFLSAKVGSITDNALGGWYGYRASKAALNQFVKTASIELKRHNKASVCVALHPGTVDTPLSAPFAKTGLNVRSPEMAADELLAVLGKLTPLGSGQFLDYQGQRLPW